jgi:hypothetical protein
MGSEKSPLNSSDSSWARAFLAITASKVNNEVLADKIKTDLQKLAQR